MYVFLSAALTSSSALRNLYSDEPAFMLVTELQISGPLSGSSRIEFKKASSSILLDKSSF